MGLLLFGAILTVLTPGSAQEPVIPASAPAAAANAREAFLRACTKCHPADRVTAQPRTRSGWEESIVNMRTARGAVFTDDEVATVLEYLVSEHSPDSPAQAAGGRQGMQGEGGRAGGRGGQAAGRGGPRPNVGAADRHRVDEVAAERGQKTYAAECVTCHGPSVRGTERGPNLVRSAVMLRDRYGSSIGPLLRQGHPMQTGTPSASLTDEAITDLSHFIWHRINDTLRGSRVFVPQDILTGDPKAGATYFRGEGGCASCHSPTGDLAGYGGRYSPVDIQQRFVFPGASAGARRGGGASSARPVTVTVTPEGAQPVSGVLVSLDDFNVALREGAGEYRTWRRTPGMVVEKQDPFTPHVELLDRLTDKAMHDVVAYLESLK